MYPKLAVLFEEQAAGTLPLDWAVRGSGYGYALLSVDKCHMSWYLVTQRRFAMTRWAVVVQSIILSSCHAVLARTEEPTLSEISAPSATGSDVVLDRHDCERAMCAACLPARNGQIW